MFCHGLCPRNVRVVAELLHQSGPGELVHRRRLSGGRGIWSGMLLFAGLCVSAVELDLRLDKLRL